MQLFLLQTRLVFLLLPFLIRVALASVKIKLAYVAVYLCIATLVIAGTLLFQNQEIRHKTTLHIFNLNSSEIKIVDQKKQIENEINEIQEETIKRVKKLKVHQDFIEKQPKNALIYLRAAQLAEELELPFLAEYYKKQAWLIEL